MCILEPQLKSEPSNPALLPVFFVLVPTLRPDPDGKGAPELTCGATRLSAHLSVRTTSRINMVVVTRHGCEFQLDPAVDTFVRLIRYQCWRLAKNAWSSNTSSSQDNIFKYHAARLTLAQYTHTQGQQMNAHEKGKNKRRYGESTNLYSRLA